MTKFTRSSLGITIVLAAALAAGCVSRRPAPVSDRQPQARPSAPVKPAPSVAPRPQSPDTRPAFHTVRKGDTLYSIALEYGLDHRELAAWNNVDPGRISVGQQLRLTPPGSAVTAAPLKAAPGTVEARPLGPGPGAPSQAGVAATPMPPSPPAAASGNVKSEPQGVRVPYSDQAYAQLASLKPIESPAPKPEARPEQKPEGAKGPDDLDWTWPATGKVIGNFSEGANLKGIAIAGRRGQPVLASAAGRVIFSGTGIRGFGKLIVIKHNDTFLSVYAHNSELLVKEGQTVAKGQKIAEMGDSDADQVKLHFEIRRFGKPVDPLKLLPDRAA
jgi:lipoprotein NlpD